MIKKAIVILFIVLVILSSIYAIIDSYPPEPFVVISIALLYILTSLVVWLNIKPPKASKAFLMIISVLISLFPLFLIFAALTHILPDRLYSGAYLGVVILGLSAALLITTFIYIVRILRLSNQTLLITLGLACALVTAAGMMWYNNLENPAVIAARKQLYDKDPGVRSQAIWNLISGFHDSKSIPEIRKLLTRDESVRVRIAAINNLGFYGDREVIPEIRKYLNSDDNHMRYAAIYALGDLSDKESIPRIREMLNVEPLHLAAIYALGKLDDKTSIPALRGFINSTETCTRNTAICALSRLGDKELIPIARKFLNATETEMPTRLTSLDALAELGDKESIPRIKELLRDEYDWMREMAEEALRQLGVPESEIQKAKEGK